MFLAIFRFGPLVGKTGPPTRAGQCRLSYTPATPADKERDVPTPESETARPVPGLFELFCGFLSLGLLGFGGIAPWARHVIVERRHWLTEHDYASFIGPGNNLPGSH